MSIFKILIWVYKAMAYKGLPLYGGKKYIQIGYSLEKIEKFKD